MLRLFAPLFVFPILFSSCKKDSEVNIENENTLELLTKDAILKKVRLLSEKKSFSEEDVINSFPQVSIKVGGLTDQCQLNDSITLHLLPNSNPDTFWGHGPAMPGAFDTRSTGVSLEIEYIPPELPRMVNEKTTDSKYIRLFLIDKNEKVLYDTLDQKTNKANKRK